MKKRDLKLCTVSGLLFAVGLIMGGCEGVNLIPNVFGLAALYLSCYIYQQTTIYRKGVK